MYNDKFIHEDNHGNEIKKDIFPINKILNENINKKKNKKFDADKNINENKENKKVFIYNKDYFKNYPYFNPLIHKVPIVPFNKNLENNNVELLKNSNAIEKERDNDRNIKSPKELKTPPKKSHNNKNNLVESNDIIYYYFNNSAH